MYETMTIDSRTMIIKTDNENELSEIIDYVSKRDKDNILKSFLDFASSKRKVVKDYKFNREACYAE
jgi:Holliday junction resolvase RusA-like endonuclease